MLGLSVSSAQSPHVVSRFIILNIVLLDVAILKADKVGIVECPFPIEGLEPHRGPGVRDWR